MNLFDHNDLYNKRCQLLSPSGTTQRRNPAHKAHAIATDPKRWRFVVTDERVRIGRDFDVPFMVVLKRALEEFPAIAMDQDVIAGTPRMRGTRIPVHLVIEAVKYYGVDGAIESFPTLTVALVKEALSFAARLLEHPVDYEAENTAG